VATRRKDRGGRTARVVGALVIALAAGGALVVPMASGATGFSNTTPVVLPRPGPPGGCPPSCPSEKATPFPSSIAVSGLAGTVTDVNVTLRSVTYEYNGLPDADVLLVAPGGKSVMVMSDACGDDENFHPVSGSVTLTFDDQASGPIPADTPCSSGTFRSLDDDDDGEFPFHVADGITDGPSPPAGTRPLADLNGIDPNGTWSLYVVDDYPNDPDASGQAGQLGGGWSLDLTTTAAAAPTTAAPATPAPPAAPTTAAPTTRPAPTTTAPAPTTAPPTTPPASDTPVEATTPTLPLPAEEAVPAASSGTDAGPLVLGAGLLLALAVAVSVLLRRRAARLGPAPGGKGWRARRRRRRMRRQWGT
jgi:hypothetical protein